MPTLLGSTGLAPFELMFDSPVSSFPAPAPGEFLVRRCIPVRDFWKRIYFCDEQSRDSAVRACGGVSLGSGKTVADEFQSS